MKSPFWILPALALAAGTVNAQSLDVTALNGKYYFVQLLVTASGGQASNAQNLSGAITFNGGGGYSYTGKAASGSGAQTAANGSGTYQVQPSGTVTLQNPIQASLQITARLSGDGNVLVGSSTEAVDNTNDFFVAVRAPAAAVTNAVLNGAYSGATLQFPAGQSAGMRTAWVALAASGNGGFSQVTAAGHSVDQGSGNVSQSAGGATYTINSDGTGSATFGSAASLLAGTRELFVSQDGNYVIGDSSDAGLRGVFIATRNFGTPVAGNSLSGRYWIAELTVAGQGGGSCSSFDFEGASGAFQAFGNGTATFSERIHENTRVIDFTGLNAYSVNADSTGELGPFLQGIQNMALGPAVSSGGATAAGSVVGAQIGALNTTSCNYGIFFAVRAPTFTPPAGKPFIDPAGVVNTASFAPFPNPTAPGDVMSLFGANLAAATVAAGAFPLSNNLGGVSVTVNGQAAPLYYVSPTQINFQTPFEASGTTATIQVTSSGALSNTVVMPLAATSPGLFQFNDSGDATRAVAQHLNGTLISAASPASAGETIVLYAVGLGALQPAVATGSANPGPPDALALVADPHVMILIGGERASNVQFLGGTPGYPGLYQINVQVPATVLPGANVPIEILTSNADSDIVDIPISM